MYDITEFLQAVLTLCTLLITAVLIPWVRSKTSQEDFNDLLAWIDIGVAAAEQIFNIEDGSAKKKYVIEFLSAKGFYVDELEIDNAIEAAVLRLHAELYDYERTEE